MKLQDLNLNLTMNKYCVVTFFTKNLNWYALELSKLRQAYCDRHGIDYIIYDVNHCHNRSLQWNKIQAILSMFQRGYTHVYWQDADSVFMPWSDHFIEYVEDFCEVKITLDYIKLFSKDVGCNTGDMYFKNTDIAVDILNTVWAWVVYYNKPYHEQSSLDQVLLLYKNDNRVSYYKPFIYNQMLYYDVDHMSTVFHAVNVNNTVSELNRVLELFFGYEKNFIKSYASDPYLKNIITNTVKLYFATKHGKVVSS